MEIIYLLPVEDSGVAGLKHAKIVNKYLDGKSLMRPRALTHCFYMVWSPGRKGVYIGPTLRSEVCRWNGQWGNHLLSSRNRELPHYTLFTKTWHVQVYDNCVVLLLAFSYLERSCDV